MSWRRERPFAPAMDHSWTSSLATRRAACTLGAAPLKTQEFLCFQITHAPRMTIELKPLRRWSSTQEEEAHHQSSKTPSAGCSTSYSKPNGCSKPAHICLAKTHEVRRWLMFSGSWLHSGHHSEQSIPLFASLSAIQHLLCSTSQTKNLHFLGAQDFQTLSAG
jgi:hypothetical protein